MASTREEQLLEILQAGAQMRRMQNKYFSCKTEDKKKWLVAAKQAERNFDEALHAQGYQTVNKEDRDDQQKLF